MSPRPDMNEPVGVLFVCLGNICRSPLAEAIFRERAEARGVADSFRIDSAGTSAYHEGAPPDRRSAEEAARRGVSVAGCSRPVIDGDLEAFDLVVAMDAENLAALQEMSTRVGGRAEIRRLREWDEEGRGLDVPDPYFGGERGFAEVHDIVERSCEALLDELAARIAG